MTDATILPTAPEVVAPGIDRVIALRPGSAAKLADGKGHYMDLFTIWGAQAALVIQRLAGEARQARTPLADKNGLYELVASRYNATIDREPTRAMGSVTLTRTGTSPGVIPMGKKFVRRPNPAAVPLPLEAAEYEVSAPKTVRSGELTVTVALRGARPGPHANIVPEANVPSNELVLSDTLFSAFTVSASEAAGGSEGPDDVALRAFATAYAAGQYAPTDLAILAGALDTTGVRHVALLNDRSNGTSKVFVADASWASSAALRGAVLQHIADDFQGFGCRVVCLPVTNTFVHVECACQLREARFLADTTAIETNMRAALRAYFDERPDWYLWRGAALRGVITGSDRRILTCSTVTVKDRAGTTLTEPVVSPGTANALSHFYFADNALFPTFLCSEASCRSYKWKSCQWNRPVTIVVIPSVGEAYRADESLGVKVSVGMPKGPVGFTQGGEQVIRS